jgi:hypothetical protein
LADISMADIWLADISMADILLADISMADIWLAPQVEPLGGGSICHTSATSIIVTGSSSRCGSVL